MRRAFAILALGSLLAMLVPSAQAQQGIVFVQVEIKGAHDDNGRLMPEKETWKIPVVVTIRAQPFPAVCFGEYQLRLEVLKYVGYASAAIQPDIQSGYIGTVVPYVSTGAPSEAKVHYATLSVTTTRAAPAFKDDEFKVRATVTFAQVTNGCTMGTGQGSGVALVKNDYVPSLLVEPTVTRQDASRGFFPVKLQNLGNGPTRVDVNFTPAQASAFSLLDAPPARLESRASKGPAAIYEQTMRIHFALREPGTQGFVATFVASYDGAGDGFLTETQTVEFLVSAETLAPADKTDPSRDDLPELPGFAHIAALASLLGAAVLRRKSSG